MRYGITFDQHGAPFPQRVPDAKFIEDVGVVHGDIADHQIGFDYEGEHVLADIASVDDLASCSPAEPSVLERGSNQALVNLFEVDGSTGCICLLTERTDNKSPLHFRSRCPSGGSHVRAEEFVPIAC